MDKNAPGRNHGLKELLVGRINSAEPVVGRMNLGIGRINSAEPEVWDGPNKFGRTEWWGESKNFPVSFLNLPTFCLFLPAMAKNTLSETFVQNAVADRLNNQHYRRKPAYVGTETYTGLKRADVLIAFMRAPNRPYTVVVEAKSRTTIHNLKLKSEPGKELWWSRGLALVLMGALVLITGYEWYVNALNTLLLLVVFIGGVSLIGLLIRWLDFSFTKSISAIEQLAGYPANESWIAISEDTFVNRAEYLALQRQCRKNGVGLIVVNSRGRLSLRLRPTPRHEFNDYLAKYGKKREIMGKLTKTTRFGPTPAERARRFRQTVNFLGGIAFVGGMGLLGYEENYGPVVIDPIATGYVELPTVFALDTLALTVELPEKQQPTEEQACTTLGIDDRTFLLADLICKTPAEAALRVATLADAGIEGMVYVSASCFSSWAKTDRYVVHTNVIYPDRDAAQAAARIHRARLDELGVGRQFGKPLKVKPL